jgi:hypothetical protein
MSAVAAAALGVQQNDVDRCQEYLERRLRASVDPACEVVGGDAEVLREPPDAAEHLAGALQGP